MNIKEYISLKTKKSDIKWPKQLKNKCGIYFIDLIVNGQHKRGNIYKMFS